MASGIVNGDGSLAATTGAVPTVSHVGPGIYQFDLALGGVGCPVPSLTPIGHFDTMAFGGGGCGSGVISTEIRKGSGTDGSWGYQVIGYAGGAGARQGEADKHRPLPGF